MADISLLNSSDIKRDNVGENQDAALFKTCLPFEELPSMPRAVRKRSAGQATDFVTHGAQGRGPPPGIRR